jgi:hypothetical protein
MRAFAGVAFTVALFVWLWRSVSGWRLLWTLDMVRKVR